MINLYKGQEAIAQVEHGKIDWLQINLLQEMKCYGISEILKIFNREIKYITVVWKCFESSLGTLF